MEVRANGSTMKIEFNASTSGSTSVQTSASEIEIKTECGWVKVKNGAKITIEKGCIKIS
jgi:predicted glutamine amidotransferase